MRRMWNMTAASSHLHFQASPDSSHIFSTFHQLPVQKILPSKSQRKRDLCSAIRDRREAEPHPRRATCCQRSACCLPRYSNSTMFRSSRLWSSDVFWSFERVVSRHLWCSRTEAWSLVARIALWRCTSWSLRSLYHQEARGVRGTALCAGAKTVFEWSAQAFLNIVLSCACRESDFQDKSFGMFWACQLAHDSWPLLWWSSRTSCQAQQACLSATLDKQVQGDQQAASASLDSQMKDGSPLNRKFCYMQLCKVAPGCIAHRPGPARQQRLEVQHGATATDWR